MLRKHVLATGNIYHIFNRGVNKNDIFFSETDYKRFFKTAVHYKYYTHKFTTSSVLSISDISDPVSSKAWNLKKMEKPKVQIFAYCLMPNHFHLLIKQLDRGGITWFMQHLINSYVHYVNIKHKRVGPLFQGRFKNVIIDSDEQLLHVSRYIHLNPVVSNIGALERYKWSSYPTYIGIEENDLVNSDLILNNFDSSKDYKKFVMDQEDYARSLEQLKHIADLG